MMTTAGAAPAAFSAAAELPICKEESIWAA